MSSIMRWRSGLMGLSDIAKAPVSHGVEPHDLETGSSLRSRRHPLRTSCRPSPRLPRARFSPYVDMRRRSNVSNAQTPDVQRALKVLLNTWHGCPQVEPHGTDRASARRGPLTYRNCED